MATNAYATDGRCHNANRGTYGHECGRPAVWLGTQPSGFQSGFCDRCKREGDEARTCVAWTTFARVPRGWAVVETDHD